MFASASQLDESTLQSYAVFAFELDDVLFPKKDYLLQVYYLYANFVEFTATEPPAPEVLAFLKETYMEEGEEGLFDKALARFPTLREFQENFQRLHHQAQLPLKLLVYPELMVKLRQIQEAGKDLVILTKGDPLMQLNKIRQTDWQGLENILKVYFVDELEFAGQEPLEYIAAQCRVSKSDILYVTSSAPLS